MAIRKKITKKACYEELERLARVVCEQKVDKGELETFRNLFRPVLYDLAMLKKKQIEKKVS